VKKNCFSLLHHARRVSNFHLKGLTVSSYDMRGLIIMFYCIYSVLVQAAMYQHPLVCSGYNDIYFVLSGHLSYIVRCSFTMNVLNFLYPPFEFFVDWLAIVFSCLICIVGTFTSVRCTLLFVVLVCAHFQFCPHDVTWTVFCVIKYRCLSLLLSVRFTF